MIFVELYTDSVFLVGIWLVFFGIYQTDTGGKLGRYISVFLFWREPLFFLERGVMAPFLRGPAPILRKIGFPAKPNSLTAIGSYMAHRFFGLCSRLITFQIFVR